MISVAGIDVTTGSAEIGIDPATGAQKFSIPIDQGTNPQSRLEGLIIAGDGYAYTPYATLDYCGPDCQINHLKLLRVNSAGAYDAISVWDWMSNIYDVIPVTAAMITNADTGVLLSFSATDQYYLATTTGTGVSVVSGPAVADQGTAVVSVLQAQDGSFVGTVTDNSGDAYMVGFDGGGGLRWSVANESPMIATADGGVIGASGVTYDSGGNATGRAVPDTQSWTVDAYLLSDWQIEAVSLPQTEWATSFQAMEGGNPSSSGTAVGVAQSVEGLPLFALKFSWGPSCKRQASGGSKVSLGGAALTQFTTEKQNLLASRTLSPKRLVFCILRCGPDKGVVLQPNSQCCDIPAPGSIRRTAVEPELVRGWFPERGRPERPYEGGYLQRRTGVRIFCQLSVARGASRRAARRRQPRRSILLSEVLQPTFT